MNSSLSNIVLKLESLGDVVDKMYKLADGYEMRIMDSFGIDRW
jgi:hypothetical protein